MGRASTRAHPGKLWCTGDRGTLFIRRWVARDRRLIDPHGADAVSPPEPSIARRRLPDRLHLCEEIGTRLLPSRGSACRAEGNPTRRTLCANGGKSIPTEVGYAHPLDEDIRQETWGLVGDDAGRQTVFPTCAACHDAGWRPPEFARVN